jgi:hypothetical protein
VGGDFELKFNSNLTRLHIPVLTSTLTGYIFIFYNHALTEYDFPLLESVGSHFQLSTNWNATRLHVPVLTFVSGEVSIVNNKALTEASLPSLQYVDLNFELNNNAIVTRLSAPALTSIATGYIIVGNNGALTEVYLPSLQSVGNNLAMFTNPKATRIDLPALCAVASYFEINTNAMLTFLNFPLLTYIGASIRICESHSSFVYPGPPYTPTGGLVVTGSDKGTGDCRLFNGTKSCYDAFDTCP